MRRIIALLGILVLSAGAQLSSAAAAGQHLPDNRALAVEVARLRVPPLAMKSHILNLFMRKLPAQHSAEHEAVLRAEIDRQYAERLVPAAVNAAADIYAKNYSRAELERLRAFYSTRTGQLLFGKDDLRSTHEIEASDAANSPAGRAFLQSLIGQKENRGVAALATRAAAEAMGAAMPLVSSAVQTRLLQMRRPGATS